MSDQSFTGKITGGLFDPQSANYGKLATRNERQRQAMINQGLAQINAIFGGGTVDFYNMANAGGLGFGVDRRTRTDPYYILSGQGKGGFKPYGGGFGGNPDNSLENAGAQGTVGILGSGAGITHAINGHWNQALGSLLTSGLSEIGGLFGGDEKSPLDKAAQLYRTGRLLNKTSATYEGFQPEFFDQRAQDYINYALPQEGQQYRTNLNATTYNLANRGLLNSTQATKQYSDLARTDIAAKQNIADQAISQSNALRQQVENAKQQAIGMLYQTGDPNLAAHNAIVAASQAQAPSVFAPIGNMFGNIATQVYTNQLLNNYRNGGGQSYGDQFYNLSGALPGNS